MTESKDPGPHSTGLARRMSVRFALKNDRFQRLPACPSRPRPPCTGIRAPAPGLTFRGAWP